MARHGGTEEAGYNDRLALTAAGSAIVVSQRDKRTTIAIAQHAHELRKTMCCRRNVAAATEQERKADGMYSHHPIAICVGPVDGINLSNDGINRFAAKFVAEHVNADLLPLTRKC